MGYSWRAPKGGSSVAFLIELARELAGIKNKLTYWLVFFDGEEALAHWSVTDGLYGSRQFAEQLRESGTEDQVRAVIVVDMIGDAHLDIQRETYSTPWLIDLIFVQARSLGYGRYLRKNGRRIEDDHLPFLRLGIPAVDVIDLDYGPFNLNWHRQSDTVDKCSAASIAIVGDTVLKTLKVLAGKSDPRSPDLKRPFIPVPSATPLSSFEIDGGTGAPEIGMAAVTRHRRAYGSIHGGSNWLR